LAREISMTDASNRFLRSLLLGLSALGLATAIGHAEGYLDSGPAHSTAADLEDHMSGTENPNDMEAQTEDPNDLEGYSEDPNDLEVGTKDPNDLEVDTEDLVDHQGRTYNLTNLEEAAPDDGFEAIDMSGQEDWEETRDPGIIVARRHVLQAEERARSARTRYGTMMHNNYPRGAAREIIVRERDESMAELEVAKQALREVDLSLPPASPY
jgi:hypothetical protein